MCRWEQSYDDSVWFQAYSSNVIKCGIGSGWGVINVALGNIRHVAKGCVDCCVIWITWGG